MNRLIVWLALVLALGAVLWFFPLFHIVQLPKAQEAKQQTAFNAAEFAKTFWHERLMKSLDQAADASTVIAAMAENPQKAREKFGRTVGISSSCFYFLRGSGRVVSVKAKGVGLSLKETGDDVEFLLPTGLLFGNTVRDATGLLDASAFPNSQHFNDISAELNRIVEAQVLPALKEQAAVGRRIQLVGCVEVGEDERDARPLKVIPVSVTVE
jgi:predicted lipoprotein